MWPEHTGQKTSDFCTTGVISDVAVNDLHGRCTRVFSAQRIENGYVRKDEPVVVLRDVWEHGDCEKEDDFIKTLGDADELSRNDVGVSSDQPDHTRIVITRGQRIPDQHSTFKLSIIPQHLLTYRNNTTEDGVWPSRSGEGDHRTRDHAPTVRRYTGGYPPKYHYRIVYKEIGTLLYRETSFDRYSWACAQISKVLRLVHDLGYVHGDLSSSNVLLYEKRIELTDWEYAKRIDDKNLHKILMGTANFMATEVDLQEYLFYKLQSERHTHQPDEEVDEDEEGSESESGSDNDNDSDSEKPMPQPAPFQYLPLHDLESLGG